ncbi:acyl-homoserine-lactone synthase [Enterovibrio coralii]|uniref:acyl-homoserine-lactone synthase n=1 Tax=Enterovibrio coralii TaxID=294935 RepID=A0A135IA43_9GAMM|nr:acyl-homoserine-lactone synthase [Enterovibrio coralii]KXF82323.1 autoinducer synthase [Enterovibrio coralii]
MYDLHTIHNALENTPNSLSFLLPNEKEKQLFLQSINDYMEATQQHDLFEKIVTYRYQEVLKELPSNQTKGNLYTTLTGPIGQTIMGIREMPDFPTVFLTIEKTAINYFGDMLNCWAELRAFQINEAARIHIEQLGDSEAHVYEEIAINENYKSEVVKDIKSDSRLFLTTFSNVPMSLSSANILINLETFVKQQHWYEMLYYLDISGSGEHFILYQEAPKNTPVLLASALIQRWHQKENWLTFDPFFRTENWTLSLDSEKILALERSNVFKNMIRSKVDTSTIEAFSYSLLDTISQKDAVCEIIRMAISGPREKLNHILFSTLKNLTISLAEIGLEVAYTIVEQPSILSFYQSVNEDTETTLPYVSLCYQRVEGTGLTTFQGIVFTTPMGEAFKQCSFREYNKRIISMRRLARAAANV